MKLETAQLRSLTKKRFKATSVKEAEPKYLSERYREVATHAGMKDYVRPLSGFVNDLQKEVGS